jgi:hypothetical protein
MRKKRQVYTGKYVAPKEQNKLPNVDTPVNQIQNMPVVDSKIKQLQNIQVPRQDFIGENYPQIFRELIKNKTIPTTKDELQKMNDNNMKQQLSDTWNKAYGADVWNQMGKQSWNPINDQNWNNQIGGVQPPWNQMTKQSMIPNWNNQMGPPMSNQMPMNQNSNNQMGVKQPSGPNWNQIENAIRG